MQSRGITLLVNVPVFWSSILALSCYVHELQLYYSLHLMLLKKIIWFLLACYSTFSYARYSVCLKGNILVQFFFSVKN